MRTCIYCRAATNGEEPIDHPILQALGMGKYPLPPGTVCGPCNSYLGQLDQNFCDHQHFAAMIVFGQIAGSDDRIRRQVAPGFAFDSDRQQLRVKTEDSSIQDRTLVLRDPGNKRFDSWKFSRGLHRIALGALALKRGSGEVLLTRYDAVRQYVRQPLRRAAFWPYFQRPSDKLFGHRTFPLALRKQGFLASFATADAATVVYLNFFISEFVVTLNGNITEMNDNDLELLADAAETPQPRSKRKWLYYDSANSGDSLLLGPDVFDGPLEG